MNSTNKYKKLIANTILFAIGTFGSKVLSVLLLPLYTGILSPGELGIADQVVQASNLILPLATVGILNAIIRYGLDRGVGKADVFTTGILVISCGFLGFLLLEPLLVRIPAVSDYVPLVYMYVLMSSLRSLCAQFVRAQDRVRLYAVDGVAATVTMVGFNVLFLVVLRMGIVGYVLATVASDFCSVLFLFTFARLWRFIRPRRGMGPIAREMLRYSVPLIPTTVLWWITNMSSRFIVAQILGNAANGLYTAAYRVPNAVVILANIFNDAWQMSAVSDAQGEGRAAFFSNVFAAFQSMVFLAASGIILLDRFVMGILMTGPQFQEAWRFVPILVLATSFSCMVTFLGSVYMVEKRSILALATTLVGAVLNVVLTLLWVPSFGINGAAAAMFVSYLCVFVLRGVSAQRMVHMNWNIPKLALNLAIVMAQAWILIQELPLWVLWEVVLTGLMMLINLRPILQQVRRQLEQRKLRRKA